MKENCQIIALIGMTGCGKSSVGKRLAQKIGAKLVDLDDEITARFGDIKHIFAEQGETAFREKEYEALATIVKEHTEGIMVLSCGGGVPTYEKSREYLAEHTTTVWLRRSAEEVAKDENVLARPPVNGSVENYKKLLDQRYPIYRATAKYSFYNAFPQRTAEAIIKKLGLKKK
ncbi:MAG: shikimate kinase [Ruminococcaceae bacterium]|nr:shikimate kinase [Oscillospiraceae bacterium]